MTRAVCRILHLAFSAFLIIIVNVEALTLEHGHNHFVERRTALGSISSIVSGSLVGLVPVSVTAQEVAATGKEWTFDAYKIIPDPGANLDPRLEKVDTTKLLQDLAISSTRSSGSAIWLGEHHNSTPDHNFQARFIRMIHSERRKRNLQGPIAIGLEQVQNQFQPVLDDYLLDKISMDEMRRLVEWNKRWMWDFEGYRGIFQAAKDLQIQLLALNVDSEDLAQVEKGGYPGTPPEKLRKYIKDPLGFSEFAKTRQFTTYVNYVIEPSYEIHQKLDLLRYTISGEKLDGEMSFQNFLSGRILWDEGMASAGYQWVSMNNNGLLVGLVGADHVKFRNGIPGRFSRMAGDRYDCTTFVINPTLIDSRPSGSVVNVPDSDSPLMPERITLQLRYLKDDVDPTSEARRLPKSTGGVLPFSDYIVVT